MFEIGQMVVAVPRDPTVPHDPLWMFEPWKSALAKLPQLDVGRIYTIRDVDRRTDPPHILVDEVIGPVVATPAASLEIGYHPCRFRPCRKTSIEELRKLVAPLKTKERV